GVNSAPLANQKEFPCGVGEIAGQNQNPDPNPIPDPTNPPDIFKLFAALTNLDDLLIQGTTPLASVVICIGPNQVQAKSCEQKILAAKDGSNFKGALSLPATGTRFYLNVEGARASDGKKFRQEILLQRK
ncbi:MAG: hypothetical protein NTV34_11630, partial [Proteobacteria bacterium]|nr:hypothetical protein [Pseudomonadota bacterium]